MNSLRKWLYRPKRSDSSLLAQFYFADEELNLVAAELDSFEGRKDPERCTALVNQLRACQARVLNVVSQMMDETVKDQRASRDFRVKFPDDVIQENLAGQLWFGAECLAAGSSIMNREIESACMRPLARALTKNLDSLRSILREQCLCNVQEYTETIRESLIIFDKLFAEFELSYVSAMVPVKTAHEYDMIQEITVLFSETVQRALKIGLLTPEMIDEYDPALMFTIPRLAIVSGVLVFKEGPLNPDNDPWNISEMFRPFQTLLLKIRELLSILSEEELNTLERALCSQEEPSFLISLEESKMQKSKDDRRKSREDKKALVKKKSKKEDSDDGSIGSELTALEIAERLEALALNFEASRNARQAQECDKQDLDAQSSTSSTSSASVCKSDADVLKESESEQSDELQHMTSQLYFEANIDSRDMDQNTLMIQSPDVCSFGDILDRDQQNESSVDAHHGCLCYAEITATNRAQFAKSKCDSSDSGLHSEPMSNSGSMFTISSNDSGQTLITRDSLSSEDSQSALHNNCTVIQFPRMSNSLNALNTNGLREGTHEMDAVCSDGSPLKCLTLNQGNLDEDIHADVTNVHEDDIMVSPLEEKKVPLEYSCSGTFSYELCSATDASHRGCSSGPSDHSNLTNTSLVESGFTHEELVANQACCNVSKREALPSFADSAVCDSAFVHCTSCCSLDDSICDKNVPDQNSSVHSIKSDGSLHNCSYVTTIETLDHITQFSPLEKVAETNNNEKDELSHGVCSGILQSEELKREDRVVCHSQTTSHMSEQSVVNHSTLSSINDHNFHKDNQSIVTVNNLSISESVDNVDISLLINSQTVNGEASFLNSMINTVCPSSDHCEFQENVIQIQAPIDNSPVLPVVPSSSTSQSNHCVPELKKSRHKNYQKSKDSKRSETKKHKKYGVESVSNKSKKSTLSTHAKSLMDSHLLDSECCNSSETSSYTSDCGDQEEIALAIKAAENATRQQVRARFRSSSDMIHRLFVCISGVADQLQTNFAGDLRNILRSVFDMNCSQPVDITEGDKCKDTTPLGAAYRAMSSTSRNARRPRSSTNQRQKPPVWIPDEQCSECMSCQVPFTFVRRRHHCRNCGKIFCNRCSSNFVPLPYIGQDQAVRVCNRCFMFRVTPFTARPAHQVN